MTESNGVPISPRRIRNTITVRVGHVAIGGSSPIVVQSMTNTPTEDVFATAKQVAELARVGSELVRVTVNTREAADAVPRIRDRLAQLGVSVPLIGDFHFNGHKLLSEHPDCADALGKLRINPGNVGKGARRDLHFGQLIEIACRYRKPVRIGVNWGSLDQALVSELMDQNAKLPVPRTAAELICESMVRSALESAEFARSVGMPEDQIVLSCKVSSVPELIEIYRRLHHACRYPLHLGLTEAGMGSKGIVASTAGLAILLDEGIGDTIRVSLTPDPGASRTTEVTVAQEILQSLGLRAFAPVVVACPGCGRTSSTVFQELAKDIQDYLREKMPVWQVSHPGVERLKVAVMGCVVNGPGESKHANVGISLPGTGEEPVAPVFVDGVRTATLRGESIAMEFRGIIERYVDENYQRSK